MTPLLIQILFFLGYCLASPIHNLNKRSFPGTPSCPLFYKKISQTLSGEFNLSNGSYNTVFSLTNGTYSFYQSSELNITATIETTQDEPSSSSISQVKINWKNESRTYSHDINSTLIKLNGQPDLAGSYWGSSTNEWAINLYVNQGEALDDEVLTNSMIIKFMISNPVNTPLYTLNDLESVQNSTQLNGYGLMLMKESLNTTEVNQFFNGSATLPQLGWSDATNCSCPNGTEFNTTNYRCDVISRIATITTTATISSPESMTTTTTSATITTTPDCPPNQVLAQGHCQDIVVFLSMESVYIMGCKFSHTTPDSTFPCKQCNASAFLDISGSSPFCTLNCPTYLPNHNTKTGFCEPSPTTDVEKNILKISEMVPCLNGQTRDVFTGDCVHN